MDGILQDQETLIDGPSARVFDSLVEHWAKSRIDAPLQMIARLDDVARHVIVVAGVLEGLMVAVFKLDQGGRLPYPGISIAAGVFLLAAVLLAVVTLFQQPKYSKISEVYDLLRGNDRASPDVLKGLDTQVTDWCRKLSAAAKRKHVFTGASLVALTAGIALIVLCFALNMERKGGADDGSSPAPTAQAATR